MKIQVHMTMVQDALRPGGGRIGRVEYQWYITFKYLPYAYAGIAYNMATAGGSGGSTTTAESARKVFK